MAMFDIFKKKKESKKKIVKKKVEPKKEEVKIEVPKVEKRKSSMSSVYNIISKPHVSEKSTDLAEINQYTFEVFPNMNKNKVKEAVQAIYGVDVLSVNMINVPGKKRRIGRSEGFKKGYKKAIVTIKAGQKIEIL